MLKESACEMPVCDFSASAVFYRNVLGFERTFQYGESLYFACYCRDGVQVHLIDASQTDRKPGEGALCIIVDQSDGKYDELVKNGAIMQKPPQTHGYCMRDFNVADIDSRRLTQGAAAS